MNTSFNEMSIFDKTSTITLYVTLGIIFTLSIIGILVKLKKPNSFQNFGKTATGVCLGYSIGIIALLLYLKYDEYKSLGYIDYYTFIPVIVLLSIIIFFAVIGLFLTVFKPELSKRYSIIAISVSALLLAAFFIYTTIRQYSENGTLELKNEIMLYIFTILLVCIIALTMFIFGKKKLQNSSKTIVYAGLCIAMSFALSYIRFFELPLGGSITFVSLLPLILYSYMFGIKKGVLAGIIYGFLQFIQAPWFYHPIQFLLDYPIAFAAIGLSGIFHELKIFERYPPIQFAIGGIACAILRYLSHVISGIFVFGSGDPENYGAVAWSFLYNSFVFADMAIALVAGCMLTASKQFVKVLNKTTENLVINK